MSRVGVLIFCCRGGRGPVDASKKKVSAIMRHAAAKLLKAAEKQPPKGGSNAAREVPKGTINVSKIPKRTESVW